MSIVYRTVQYSTEKARYRDRTLNKNSGVKNTVLRSRTPSFEFSSKDTNLVVSNPKLFSIRNELSHSAYDMFVFLLQST